MHPKGISIFEYTYNLPKERIAEFPLQERDESKLLIWDNGNIKEDIYKHIASYLPKDSLIIFNNSKVIPARIYFQKPSGGVIEIFCLEPYEEGSDYHLVMGKKGSVKWKCIIGGASKWKGGALEKELEMPKGLCKISVALIKKLPDSYVCEISWEPAHYSFAEILEVAGEVPLPPYIKRKPREEDKERYQTIYAKEEGSVAAPTAGLHFTSNILSSIHQKNIITDFVTLHVGAGTFKPVKAEVMKEHTMHEEWIDVSRETIKNLREHKGDITAVGTTSARTLESLYWMGVKSFINPMISPEEIAIKQWEVYESPLVDFHIPKETALNALNTWLAKNKTGHLVSATQLLIAPGYQFKVVDILVTNFHQPQSTLLLLVAAAAGKDWMKIYEYALSNGFRFLSYGDGCLIYINKRS